MMRSPVIEHNGYKLRFAWHEKLWCFKGATNTGFRSTDRYFELLRAAKGVSLESIVNSFYDFSKYAVNSESVVYDRENQCPINDETSKYHEDFYSLRREAAKGNKSLRYMLCRELIEYFSKKSPVGPEEIKLKEFIDKFNVQETRGYLSHFLLDGTFFYNFEAVTQLIEAYRAFGSVLGKYLKPFQKSSHPVESGKLFETPELDPHANNIFYDASSKTVTWIDLQKTGEDFVKPKKDTYTTIGYANHIIFGCFFYPGCRNQLFKNGLEFFFPDYETNPNLKIKLLEERDKLFNAVRGILEAFVEGFASNWETKEDKKLLREHFKERWHFPYSTPAEFFTNADEPFVFG
jgi:hypothetical protein